MEASKPDAGIPASACGDRVIREQAAEWVATRRARPLTAGEAAAFHVWRADPRRAGALAEVEMADHFFDRLAFFPRDAGQAVDPDLLVRARRRLHAWALVAGATAAMVAVGFLAGRGVMPSGASPAVPIVATVRFLHLPDGSRVELNAGGEIAEHFTAAERRIRLVRGEAHFEVAKNPQRPFIVEADSVAVQAVGTAFDVRLGATTVDVLVTEGRVGVTTAADRAASAPANRPSSPPALPSVLGPGLILSAGQRTEVPTTPPPREPFPLAVEDLTQHQIDRALAWQTSRLVFDDMPLAEVVTWFNRSAMSLDGSAAVQLKVRGADLEALRISGRIRYDSADNLVDVLEQNFGVTAERRGSEIVLSRHRP
jgi:transmembrane sensor